ncbi:MAG: response regulator, partial [Candidatus Aminicenantes bacterium]|nr:response regulator [Candidatus Aminicenantes bacterium]
MKNRQEIATEANDTENTYSILVVEDDKGLQRLIQKKLERDGFNVAAALSGMDAVAWVEKKNDTLLLLDYRLGDMTGKDVIDHLLKKEI